MMLDLPPTVTCAEVRVIDGDTIACANLPEHVRLLAIDAPELPGHCRANRVCTPGDGEAAKAALARLIGTATVTCAPAKFDRYGRILARCSVGKIDLSCAMVAAGDAVERYSPLGDCPSRLASYQVR